MFCLLGVFLCHVHPMAGQSTPVIGGPCKMGSADVNIGGKQTKFFLHCESDDPSSADGVWVVKSHANAPAPTHTPAGQQASGQSSYSSSTIFLPNQPAPMMSKSYGPMGPQYPDGSEAQHTKKSAKMPSAPIVCEQNLQARENGNCNVPEACLQPNVADPNSYLQCSPATHKWIKKNCQPGFAFNFEHQSCIGHPKTFRTHVARQQPNSGSGSGVVCTYSQCSQSNPCSVGTCNNGYCCSSSPSIAGTIPANLNLKPSNKTLTALSNFLTVADDWPSIPVGGPLELSKLDAMLVKAAGDGYAGCPGGGQSTGSCVSGQCGPGFSCNSNNMCCAQVVPATVCPDGTQAAGACVGNMCGVGFTCNQGLCCTNSSQTPRCLDGSQAIGACMQGRCGTGYTCTTGNICCPSTLNSCPNGQTSIGQCVNGRCPDGYNCINNQCCGPPVNGNAASLATCDRIDSNGPCLPDGSCPEPGYACDTTNNWCCPQIMGNPVGPCITGAGAMMHAAYPVAHRLRAPHCDPNGNMFEGLQRPLPTTNAMSTQLYADLGIDPLSAFVQSNQNCANLFNQYMNAKNEYPNATHQGIATPEEELRHLHGYIFELDAKIERLKMHVASQMETSWHMMSQAMHSLVADKLVGWLIRQKELSCAARAIIRKHYENLDQIDIQFEECGRQIVTLMSLLNNVEQTLACEDATLAARLCKLQTQIVQGSRQFIWQSFVVSVQPPAVLVKCRGSDSYRSTRFPCRTEVRLLGGEALGVRNSATTVRVDLISEEMARRIQQDSCQSAVKDQSFHLIYNEANFRLDPPAVGGGTSMYRAAFDKIRLVESATGQKRSAVEAGLDEKRSTRRSKVSSLRYYLAYQVQTGPFLQNFGTYGQSENGAYVDVSGYKLSLPVAALVHSSLEAEASLFWNRSFAEGTGILSAVPEAVSWEQAKVALDLKWGALIQEPQDVRDLNLELPEPRPLSVENLDHLARRLGVVDGVLHKKNFFNRTVAHKEKDGGPMPSVFYEWFYKCASVVNKYMQEQWNDGIITGFCSKEDSERILRAALQPTMLIRFSDMVLGFLKISCKLADHRCIYPNRRVSALWQNREKMGESRAASWSSAMPPGYFDTVYSLESKPVAAIN
ncbi:protein of unknown function domain containing protein, protein [Aphelenchoides fujianensis]|nr:protein of unknown function domain containing protein, protein [Aphelenchoides fujianensis]